LALSGLDKLNIVYKLDHQISKSITDDWVSTPTSDPSFIARWWYRITHSCACSN